MSAEDAVGVQTRAMAEAQRTESEVQRIMDNNQEGGQRAVQDTGRNCMRSSNEPCSRNSQKR